MNQWLVLVVGRVATRYAPPYLSYTQGGFHRFPFNLQVGKLRPDDGSLSRWLAHELRTIGDVAVFPALSV